MNACEGAAPGGRDDDGVDAFHDCARGNDTEEPDIGGAVEVANGAVLTCEP